MSGTIGIFLAPVMDRNGLWAGVWLHCSPGYSGLIEGCCQALSEDAGGLRIFLDVGDGLPAACLDTLPAERVWIVGRDGKAEALQQFAGRGLHTVALGQQFVTGIATPTQLDAAKAQGAEWFSGAIIAHPPIADGTRDAGRSVLLKLLTLVAQDADSTEIEQVFKREPGLSFNLFRLVNSVSMGLNTKISTFNQAIMVLGRRQMQRWIQLMLYTSKQGDNDAADPLLQLAAMRAKLMERLAMASGWDAAVQERAFMAGIFSLLDSLLGMSMAEIVKVIPLPDDVQSALLGHEGNLSEMLALVESLQASDSGVALPAGLNLDAEKIAACQLEALRWAAGMSREMS